MRVPLIYLSVIMILSFVTCSDDIEDLSKWCINGQTRYYNLTSGAGSRDILVSRTATEGKINCTLKFTVKAGNYIMITLQFPDMKEHERVCYIEYNTTIILRDYIKNGSCLQWNSTEIPYCKLSKENLSLHFRSDSNMSAVKVSVTPMGDDAVLNCSQNKKSGCFVDVKLLHERHVVQGKNSSDVPEDPVREVTDKFLNVSPLGLEECQKELARMFLPDAPVASCKYHYHLTHWQTMKAVDEKQRMEDIPHEDFAKIFEYGTESTIWQYNKSNGVDINKQLVNKIRQTSLSFFVITCSLVMVLITLFLLFAIAMSMVPRRKDPYIHAFDQSMSLFDCENGIVTVDLNIIIIFPPAKR